MYPNNLFNGIQFNLYDLFLCLGIIVCLVVFDKLAVAYPIRNKLQMLCYVDVIFAIVLGLGSAVVVQAFYNFIQNGGQFVIDSSTGATFYGGLLGGAGVFIAIYFIAGSKLFPDKYHKRSFFSMANCAVPSILIAHSLGRIGCLMAGCCHGDITEAWYGIMMHTEKYGYAKCVPTQLFEALFLLALFIFTVIRVKKKLSLNLPIYMMAYGAWRFFVEFLRSDDRGQLLSKALSPSQIIACVMILGGLALLFFEMNYEKRHRDEILSDQSEILSKREQAKESADADEK